MWKCFKCGWSNNEDFCVHCKTNKNDPIGHLNEENNTSLPPSGKSINPSQNESVDKGISFVIFMVIVFFALMITLIVVGVHFILSNENRIPVTSSSESPFDLSVWETTTQIEYRDETPLLVPVPPDSIMTAPVEFEGFHLPVPMLPDSIMGEDIGYKNAVFFLHENVHDYFAVNVVLGPMIGNEWAKHSELSMEFFLEFHRSMSDILDYIIYEEEYAKLKVIHWEDYVGRATSFLKISPYRGMLLFRSVSFDTFENRDDFFEAFGFFDIFEQNIRLILDDLASAGIPIDYDRSFEDETPIFVAAGGSRSYVITEGGTLWNWGVSRTRPTQGIMVNSRVPVPIMEDVVFVSAGNRHTMAITEDGTLWGWGENTCGQIGNGVTAVWQTEPIPVLENVIYVSVGAHHHTMAITEDGTLWGWGGNNQGQLGIGTARGVTTEDNIFILYPTVVKENVRSVSAASQHTIAITNDGNLWGWGSNRGNALGINAEDWNDERLTNGFRLTPILIMEDVISASASYTHTMAVTSDGILWGWGGNSQGRFIESESLRQVPAPLQVKDDIVLVYVRWGRTFAIDSDNTLWAWGDNRSGGVGNGTYDCGSTPYIILENIVAIAGECHTLAIDSDGVLWGWGSNVNGQLGDGSIVESRNYPVRLN